MLIKRPGLLAARNYAPKLMNAHRGGKLREPGTRGHNTVAGPALYACVYRRAAIIVDNARFGHAAKMAPAPDACSPSRW